MRTGSLRLAAALFAALLGGCAGIAPGSVSTPTDGPPPEFPEAFYQQAAGQGKPVFRVDAAASLVVIEVGRSGSLARLGHDHIVSSRDVGGYLAPDEGRADLYVPLAKLAVDEPALRKEAGLDTQPTESDVAGTRSNMLERVLEVREFPFALIRVGGADAGMASIALTLHGNTRMLQVPVKFEVDGNLIRVAGSFSFDQTDFGMAPYSVLGGAIAVRNTVDLRFRIVAARMSR